MRYEPLDSASVVAAAKGRAVLETELAKRMYRVFDSPPLIDTLRNFVGLAIEQIVALGLSTHVRVVQYTRALREYGKDLAVWREREPSLFSLKKVLGEKNTWSAAECSDLIRLFGEYIEDKKQLLQPSGEVGRDVDQFRRDQRPGQDYIWDEKFRARNKVGFQMDPVAPHTAAGREAMLKFKRVPQGFSGITKTGLADTSTVKKIDFVFGLPEGCDISGTTADSVFFMRHVNAFIQGLPETIPADMVPIVQLLPMATMVSQAHHTLLECALTLTLNGIMKYRIGFYTTLMPLGSNSAPLRAVFQTFEKDWRNKHMLCYMEGGVLRARWYTDDDALHRFKELATVSFPFVAGFTAIPPHPTREALRRRHRFAPLLQ